MSVPLRITERVVNGVMVLQLDGHLVFDDGDRALRERVTDLVRAGVRLLLIDLHGLSYIDSGGVGALVEMDRHVVRAGGRLTLLCPSSCTIRALHITHLSTVFEIFQDEETAIRSMSSITPHPPGSAVGRAS
jgi:anti-sigma B factor antagonist